MYKQKYDHTEDIYNSLVLDTANNFRIQQRWAVLFGAGEVVDIPSEDVSLWASRKFKHRE